MELTMCFQPNVELHILGDEPSGQTSGALLTTVATMPLHRECTCEMFLKDSTPALLSVRASGDH